MNKTLDQRRAEHAWEAIERIGEDQNAKEYAREAKKLPIRIMAAGLGQALSFILAKAKNSKPKLKKLHEDITDWVIAKRGIPAKVPDHLLESICRGDSDFLRRATDEVLAYLQWLNRFAEAKGLSDDDKRSNP
jgi:CRISPR-associated protein Cmr5